MRNPFELLPLKRLDYFLRNLGSMLFRRTPLTSPPSQLSCNPFFIIGSGRSGNTLLRAMLVQHPGISIPPESYALPDIVRKFIRYNFLPWRDLTQLIMAEFESHPNFHTWKLDMSELYQRLYRLERSERSLARAIDLLFSFYAQKAKPGASRWGDKTPINTLNLGRINWVFPEAQYVHIIRDGRDVISSYIETAMYEDVESAAKRWLVSVERARAFGKRIGERRFLEIRYEDLVRDPGSTLQAVGSFLGFSYVPSMLDFWKYTDQLGDSMFAYHANVKNPVSSNSVGRWHQRLNAEQQVRLKKLLGAKLGKLGYTEP